MSDPILTASSECSELPDPRLDLVPLVERVAARMTCGSVDAETANCAMIDARAAMTTLYDATSSSVYGLCLKILGDPSAAEDAAAEVYVQVWRTAAAFDSGRGQVRSWINAIARTRAIDRARRESRRSAVMGEMSDDPGCGANADLSAGWVSGPLDSWGLPSGEAGAQSDPESCRMGAETAAHVRAALADLPVEQREVVELAYYGGLSQSEIASKLASPLGTIKSRTRAAMEKLRSALEPNFDDLRTV